MANTNGQAVKLFISQPMTGISEDKFIEDREFILKKIQALFPDTKFETINPYRRPYAPEDAHPLWYLGRAIQDIPEADAIVFAEDFADAKGSMVEHYICSIYGLPIIMEDHMENKSVFKKRYAYLYDKFDMIMKGDE